MPDVLICADLEHGALELLLDRYQLGLSWVPAGERIEGSYWGECEAGLVGSRLLVRPDTPVHSALHEACHYVCMDEKWRRLLHTNAGGGCHEENAACYLQILLADALPGVGSSRMMVDMDAWGYSFRLGSTRAWFEQDARDTREWLLAFALITERNAPSWRLRMT